MAMNLGKFQELVRGREAWHAAVQRVGNDLATEQQYIYVRIYVCVCVCVCVNYLKLMQPYKLTILQFKKKC